MRRKKGVLNIAHNLYIIEKAYVMLHGMSLQMLSSYSLLRFPKALVSLVKEELTTHAMRTITGHATQSLTLTRKSAVDEVSPNCFFYFFI
jgi:hypothetical protein